MKLEPVYLVAPRPTRRAFLLAGGAFAGGVVVGGAGGFALGVNSVAAPVVPESIAPSGNAELDDLRRLAVEAPIEELAGRYVEFLLGRERGYPNDSVLVRGVVRLANHVLAHEELSDRSIRAKTVLRAMGVGAAVGSPALKHLAPRLEAVAR